MVLQKIILEQCTIIIGFICYVILHHEWDYIMNGITCERRMLKYK